MNGSAVTFGRAIFSSLIPRGHEAEFFSLYQLTDKGTAWLGPLVMPASCHQSAAASLPQ